MAQQAFCNGSSHRLRELLSVLLSVLLNNRFIFCSIQRWRQPESSLLGAARFAVLLSLCCHSLSAVV
jgi:hypothetical protein